MTQTKEPSTEEPTELEPKVRETLLSIAKEAIRARLIDTEITLSKYQLDHLKAQGVLVTLKTPDLNMRGQMGAIEPSQLNLPAEVAANAVMAAFQDSRFTPLTQEEFNKLSIELLIFGEVSEIDENDLPDPKEFGLLVTSGWRRAFVLPETEGIETYEDQFEAVMEKAGIDSTESVLVRKFTVEKFET